MFIESWSENETALSRGLLWTFGCMITGGSKCAYGSLIHDQRYDLGSVFLHSYTHLFHDLWPASQSFF